MGECSCLYIVYEAIYRRFFSVNVAEVDCCWNSSEEFGLLGVEAVKDRRVEFDFYMPASGQRKSVGVSLACLFR